MSISLPYSFFMDEVRDGFYVPAMMKRVWAVCMDELETLREEVDKNDGSVYACFGTLLGAVRAGGFVPWDDDIDVDMFREDYNRLKLFADKGCLPGDYAIHDYVSDGGDNDVRKLHDRKTRIISSSEWTEHFGYPYDNNIDIFLLDHLPDDKDEREYYEQIIKNAAYLKTMYKYRETDKVDSIDFDHRLKTVRELTGIDTDKYGDVPFETRMMLLSDEFMDRYTSGKDVIKAPYYINYGSERIPERYYDHTIEMRFEGITIPAPAGYDGILRGTWGNYMRLVFASSGHEYPCFESYEDDLKRLFDMELFKYHIDVDRSHMDMGERPHKKAGKRWSVCFLTYRASDWNSVHKLWSELTKKEEVDVTVIVMPYFYRGFDGDIISDDMQLEADGYPDDVVLIPFDSFDIGEWHPDVIITQYPYDEYSESMDVLPFFHTRNLIRYTDHLVLIPPYDLREVSAAGDRLRKMLRRYLRNPGFIYADRIYVQSEEMKQVYIEELEEFLREEGCDDLDLHDKIQSFGSTALDEKRINSNDKKSLLMQFTGSRIYCMGDEVLNKASQVIDQLSGYSDRLGLMYLEDQYAEVVLKEKCPDLWETYQSFLESLPGKGVKLFSHEQEDEAVENADGFYGDGCIAMNRCRIDGKPVMMEDIGAAVADEAHEYKQWTDDMTAVLEGEWSLENFVEEVIRYDKADPGCAAEKIIASLEDDLFGDGLREDETEKNAVMWTGRPLRLLVYEWNSYMRRDTGEALKNLGISYDVYTYNDYRALKDENPEVDRAVSGMLATGNYDAVFSLNYRTVIARCAYRAGVPYISWIYDCPFGIGEDEEVLKYPTNHIFTFDRRTCSQLADMGIEYAYHQPLAVNVDRIDQIGINPEDREKYGADVSFVGKLYPSKFDAFYKKLSPYEAGMVDCALEAQSKMYGAYLLDVITEGVMSEKIQTAIEGTANGYDRLFHESLQSIICKEITRRERLMLLYLVSQEYKTALYTNKSEDMLDKVLDRGVVDGYEEIYKVYKTSKINLNITFKRIAEGIPLRALDIMGAGGFLLSNYQPELVEYFEPGVDCVVYESIEDAYGKVSYYLKHEDERRAIAKSGRDKVKAFSYERQLRQILDTVFIK